MFFHRFHRFSQMVCVWNSVCSVGPPTPPVNLCKSVQSVGGLFWLRGVSHRIHGIHRTDLQRCSPTEFTEFTEQTGRDILPQISQILTDGACLEFCEFREFCGTSYVPSESVRICEICGRIISVAWVIARLMPSAWLVHFCLVGAFCFVGALETSAPPIGLRRKRGSRRAAGSG